MQKPAQGRRGFLKGALAGSTAAATAGAAPAALAQSVAARPAADTPAGYQFLRPAEGAFIEALVDHMVPADNLSPKGTDLQINVYIDRALAGAWGRGDRLFRQGPWKRGLPQQGYQLPLTPAELMRAGIEAANAVVRKSYGKNFDQITPAQREEFLKALDGGKIAFDRGPPAGTFWAMLYQTVMEGMFADPIYGGNRDKAGWKMIGFPGVIATHARNITTYKNKPYTTAPQGIADVS
jgi:gluconate 2-dehydrogenase gamma chain